MSYVDAKMNYGKVYVSERDEDGTRRIRKYDAPYYFYLESEEGTYTTMYGDRAERIDFKNAREFRDAVEQLNDEGHWIYESDVRPEYKTLEKVYGPTDPPKLHVAFLDIEVDYDPAMGFARPNYPYAPISAITIYQSWTGQTTTVAIPPQHMSLEEADELIDGMENCFVVDSEADLLEVTLDLLEDADVTTGWNSEFFDMPYIVQRIRQVLGDEQIEMVCDENCAPAVKSVPHLKRLCLFGCLPEARKKERFGAEETYFEFPGKPHLDYMALYRKFTFVELHSYSLDSVLQEEIKKSKVKYDGTLEQLYKNDFKKFVEYNVWDTMGMVEMDNKLKFIDLANEMKHMANVLFKDTLGSVSIIEQAILAELHEQGMVAPDKDPGDETGPVAGAFVKEPIGGLFKWVASYDINSLYPSVIRMLNISPETVVGQIDLSRTYRKLDELVKSGKAESRTEAWHWFTGTTEFHLVEDQNVFEEMEVELEDGEVLTMNGQEIHEWIEGSDLSISANGTIFSLERQGIIPFCLEKWYNERVQFKKMSKEFKGQGDQEAADYWDRIQHVRKIFLNSTYGALLNRWFRFSDPRFGQSVTLSGRVVTKHMARKAGEILDERYATAPPMDPDEFTESFITGDTDSAYMTLDKVVDGMDLDEIVAVADEIGRIINESFPAHMDQKFMVGEERGAIIEAGREVVAERGLFKNKKKRYALYVKDTEGFREDKLKIMGMDTQRSDTPAFVQDFLKDCIKAVVQDGCDQDRLKDMIEEFRDVFYERNPWENGVPCRVSNLTANSRILDRFHSQYDDMEELFEGKSVLRRDKVDKPRVHYSVTAAYNTNKYREHYEERDMDQIRDGDKIMVFNLKKDQNTNPKDYKSVALSVDAMVVPDWFKQLPFDTKLMEKKLIDRKIENTFGIMGWDLDKKTVAADAVFG